MPESMTAPAVPEGSRRRGAGGLIAWSCADAGLLLLFAATGRRTHEHGISVSGVLETAWPFLLAYLLTALAARTWRSPGAVRPTALVLWAGTVAGGLVLRAVTGAGVAPSFQIVTLLVLGAVLVLPRAAMNALAPRRHLGPVA